MSKSSKQYLKNREYVLGYQKEHNKGVINEAYQILGNKCAICGIDDQDVLCIDHIDAIGGANRKMTIAVCYEVKLNPEKAKEKYQILCRNCNWKKAILNNERRIPEPFALKRELEMVAGEVKYLRERINTIQNQSGHSTSCDTMKDLSIIAKPLIPETIGKDGRINATTLRIILREKGVSIGFNKTYELKKILEREYRPQTPQTLLELVKGVKTE